VKSGCVEQDQKLRWSVGRLPRTVSPLLSPGCVLPGLDAAFAGLYGVPGFTSIGQYGTPRNDDFFYGTIDVKEHQTALFGEVTYEVVPKVERDPRGALFQLQARISTCSSRVRGSAGAGRAAGIQRHHNVVRPATRAR